MSLVSSDAEGEQNEIRNLQEKLESAMRLVANLSGQLTELKEQVYNMTVNHPSIILTTFPVKGQGQQLVPAVNGYTLCRSPVYLRADT